MGQVLEVKPLSAWAHYNLGVLSLSVGDRQPAVEHLQEALRINPDFPQAQLVLRQALAE